IRWCGFYSLGYKRHRLFSCRERHCEEAKQIFLHSSIFPPTRQSPHGTTDLNKGIAAERIRIHKATNNTTAFLAMTGCGGCEKASVQRLNDSTAIFNGPTILQSNDSTHYSLASTCSFFRIPFTSYTT